ncbi:hypothetical protein H1R20_g3136, partial [Candolleomyces eurysporus]
MLHRPLHRGAGREIREGQKIHCSVLLGENYKTATTDAKTAPTDAATDAAKTVPPYKPKARIPAEWVTSKGRPADGQPEDGQPADGQPADGRPEDGRSMPFDSVDWISHLMTNDRELSRLSFDSDNIRARVKHATQPDDVIKSLEKLDSGDIIVESEKAKVQTMYDQVVYAVTMERFKDNSDAQYSIVQHGMALLPKKDTSQLELVESSQSRRVLEGLLKDNSESSLVEEFIAKFIHPFYLRKLTSVDWHQVRSVAVSPNGKIVCGTSDEKIRVWDVRGELEELKGNKTTRTWDATAKEHWYSRRPERHTEPVVSVAISPDGKRVVSATRDKTIRIWNTETGGRLRAIKVPGVALSVAISHDSKYVVAGCEDKMVRIWNAETGRLEAMRGHTDRDDMHLGPENETSGEKN